jgi:hypothetical protein
MRTLAVLLLVGCGSGSFTPRREQSRAEQIVWRQQYEMSEPPPPVEWVAAVQLPDGIGGRTLIGWKVQVACGDSAVNAPDEDGCGYPIFQTEYAHELLHWRAWLRTGDVDAMHAREDWSAVERANTALSI